MDGMDGRHGHERGGLVFFSFWVLLGSSGVPSGVLLVFFWCSSGVLLAFFWCSITQKNARRTQKNPEEHQKNTRHQVTRRTRKNPEARKPRRRRTQNTSPADLLVSHFGCCLILGASAAACRSNRLFTPAVQPPVGRTGGPTAYLDRRSTSDSRNRGATAGRTGG